jgi:hypothetical protein
MKKSFFIRQKVFINFAPFTGDLPLPPAAQRPLRQVNVLRSNSGGPHWGRGAYPHRPKTTGLPQGR